MPDPFPSRQSRFSAGHVLSDAGLRNFRWQTTYGADFCTDFKEPPHLPVLKRLYAGSCRDFILRMTVAICCYHGCSFSRVRTIAFLHLQSELNPCET